MQQTIFISAGHGGRPGKYDSGAVGNGLQEAQVALRFRDLIAAELRARSCLVATDGRTGENLSLTDALAGMRNATGPKVELHLNAGPPSATGIEALAKPAQKKLAQALAQAVNAATGLPLRGDAGWKSDSSGQHHRLAVCEAGGVVLELAFISNAVDMHALLSNDRAVAVRVAQTLAAFADG